MARGRMTSPLVMKAVRLLDGHLAPLEIAQVLGLPRRTTYDLLDRVQSEVAREEAERQRALAEEQARLERERLDRQRFEQEVFASLAREREMFKRPVEGRMKDRRFGY